jgi:FMN phosphatase YigB (HAD superfamily)
MIDNLNFPEENVNLCIVDFQGAQLVSFDFFDTLVYRNSVNHFQLWKNYSKKYFYRRFRAEVFARIAKRSKGIPEIAQNDIYSRMPEAWDLNFELDLEQKSLSLNPVVLKALHAAQIAGAKVCIISDTHFRAKDIEKILLGFKITNVQVFTSGDYALTKSTGLFPKVQSILNVSYQDWIHIGDNLKSDIKSAERIGIKAIYYPHMKLQLIRSGLVSQHGYEFLRKSGESGNAAIVGMFNNLLLAINNSPNGQTKMQELFGSIIANLISKSIAREIHAMHVENQYDLILYSSRDGWLPYLAHKHIFCTDPIVYFKTSRRMLNDPKFDSYVKSIVGDSRRVLLYDIGWRGTTAKKIVELFPQMTWDFVYWQILGQKTLNQFELNSAGFINRLRIWRSRDFLEAVFTDESKGFDRIGIDLRPQERAKPEDSIYKSPILSGATKGITWESAQVSLNESSLILESFARYPSADLISHFEGHVHEVNEHSKSILVTTTWQQLFGKSRILWAFGSQLTSGSKLERQLFASVVFLKESCQRIYNLAGRLFKNT